VKTCLYLILIHLFEAIGREQTFGILKSARNEFLGWQCLPEDQIYLDQKCSAISECLAILSIQVITILY